MKTLKAVLGVFFYIPYISTFAGKLSRFYETKYFYSICRSFGVEL